MPPVVSVVMAAHNAERWIGATAGSVLSQDVDLELLIVDDASRDDTLSIVTALHDPRVRVFAEENNVGAVAARNIALREARGTFVAVCDADDPMVDGKLAAQVALLEHLPSVDVCGTAYRVIDEAGANIYDMPVLEQHIDIARALFLRNPLGHSTTVIRRAALEHVGGWVHGPGEDYDLWYRLWREGVVFAGLNRIYTLYRVHSSSRTATRRPEQQRTFVATKTKFWSAALPRRDPQDLASVSHLLRASGEPMDCLAGSLLAYDQVRLLLASARRGRIRVAGEQARLCLKLRTLSTRPPAWLGRPASSPVNRSSE